MTIPRLAKAGGTLLLLFVCVYAPAFAVVAYFKPAMVLAVPIIIAISLTVAMVLISALSRTPEGLAEFGFRFCPLRYIAAAVVLGAPIGWGLCLLVSRFAAAPAMPGMSFRPWIIVLYFVVGAAVQEEVIFRGLLQSIFARQFPARASVLRGSTSWAVLAAALLFGLIHLEVNPLTAAAALVLGVLAGELRRRSSSLLPAILVHAIFNGLSALV